MPPLLIPAISHNAPGNRCELIDHRLSDPDTRPLGKRVDFSSLPRSRTSHLLLVPGILSASMQMDDPSVAIDGHLLVVA